MTHKDVCLEPSFLIVFLPFLIIPDHYHWYLLDCDEPVRCFGCKCKFYLKPVFPAG